MKKLGLIDPSWQLTRTVGDWEGVKNKAWEARCMEVYAAMIDSHGPGHRPHRRRAQDNRSSSTTR